MLKGDRIATPFEVLAPKSVPRLCFQLGGSKFYHGGGSHAIRNAALTFKFGIGVWLKKANWVSYRVNLYDGDDCMM